MSNFYSDYLRRTPISLSAPGLNGVFTLSVTRSGARGQVEQ